MISIGNLLKTLIISGILLLAVLVSLGISGERNLKQASSQLSIAHEALNAASQLVVLTHEYALFQEARAREQWRQVHALLSELASRQALEATPYPDYLADQLTTIGYLFERLVALNDQQAASPAQADALLSQLLLFSQLIADTLSDIHHQQLTVQQTIAGEFHWVSLLTPGVALLLLIALGIAIQHNVTTPLHKLAQEVVALTAQTGNASLPPTPNEFKRVTHSLDHLSDALLNHLRALDAAQDMILMIDQDTLRIRYANQGVCRGLGVPKEDLYQRYAFQLRPPYSEPEFRHWLATTLTAHDAPTSMNTTLRCHDGSLMPVAITIQCLSHHRIDAPHDNKGTYIAIARDISEQQKLEAMKSEFVATVSHELRTPLTAIIGGLGLVHSQAVDVLPAPISEMLNVARRNADRLASLVNDLLDFERITQASIALQVGEFALPTLLSEALSVNTPYAQTRQVTLVLQDCPERVVQVDKARFLQMISNLIANAVRFSPEHGLVVIQALARDQRVRVDVIDCGPGVPKAFQQRIFQPFAQADTSNQRQTGGTGLGLAISKAYAEAMGGELGYDPDYQGGAHFYVWLPVAHGVSE